MNEKTTRQLLDELNGQFSEIGRIILQRARKDWKQLVIIYIITTILLFLILGILGQKNYSQPGGQLIYKGATISIYREFINGRTCEVARNGLMQKVGKENCL